MSIWRPSHKMLPLHNSHAEAYGACPEAYNLSINFGVQSEGYIQPLIVGSAMHAATAEIRAGYGPDDAIDAAVKVVANANKPAEGDEALAVNDVAKLNAMIRGYWNRWKDDLEPIFTGDNEVLLRAPLINPATGKKSRTFYLEGILDASIFNARGPILYEQKTTSDTVRETLAYLNAGLQVPLYLELLRFNVGEPAGAILDVIKKPILARKNSKKNGRETLSDWTERCIEAYSADPNRFFGRVEIPYSESRQRWALKQLWLVAEGIRHANRYGYRAVRSWKVCKSAMWCKFKSLCWYDDIEGYTIKGIDDSNAKSCKQGEANE